MENLDSQPAICKIILGRRWCGVQRYNFRYPTHAPSDNYGSCSFDSGEATRNRVLQRTIRRLEKQVETLTTMCSAYRKQLVDGSLVATGVHDMPQMASYFMGERKVENLG